MTELQDGPISDALKDFRDRVFEFHYGVDKGFWTLKGQIFTELQMSDAIALTAKEWEEHL